MRNWGVLLHLSSLPGPEGIGTLGQEAYAFADFLQAAGAALWQVLPAGPVGYGESPYQSGSVYAGNPLFIDLRTLRAEGLLDGEIPEMPSAAGVDFDTVRIMKNDLLKKSFEQSWDKCRSEAEAFAAQRGWVRDFALFMALKEHFGGVMWKNWPDADIRLHKPAAVAAWSRKLEKEINCHIYCQWLFAGQWEKLRAYCRGKGIRMFGDMPIYVAEDSADTWSNRGLFQMDRNGHLRRVAGVPPDYFSEDGQLWGNPLYRWTKMRLTGYKWWVERMRTMSERYDVLRIDHFIGFANYYSIPGTSKTARIGRWVIGPGASLFRVLEKKVPGISIVAEDLGCVTDRVRKLLRTTGYPGMRVLQFGFGGDDTNIHLTEHYEEHSVVYTGTHDNDTALGWYRSADEKAAAHAAAYLQVKDESEIPEAFMRKVMASRAETAVLPMQDILHLGGEARMNLPGTTGCNWRWRMLPGAADAGTAAHLRQLARDTGR